MGCGNSAHVPSPDDGEAEEDLLYRHYEDLAEDLKTGDVLLVSGRSAFSLVARMFTRSRWSHVGMIVKTPHFREDPDDLYLWHSVRTTDHPYKDVLSDSVKSGPQLNGLRQFFSGHSTAASSTASVRRVTLLKPERRTGAVLLEEDAGEGLLNWMLVTSKGKDYEQNLLQLVRSSLPNFLGRNREDTTSLFCSELVALTYRRMGLFHHDSSAYPTNDIVPADFARLGTRPTWFESVALGWSAIPDKGFTNFRYGTVTLVSVAKQTERAKSRRKKKKKKVYGQ